MPRLLTGLLLLALLGACTSTAVEPLAAPAAPTTSPSPQPTPSPAPSPSPSPSPSPEPPPLTAEQEALAARLAAAVTFPEGVTASVSVLTPDGTVVFEHDGELPVLPASTAKLAAGAAALTLFGPEHRLPTRVQAAGTIGDDGVLRGRLELVGGGDPALSQADYRSLVYVARPHTDLEELADAVVDAGIEVVTGGLGAAPDAFGDTPLAPGWKDEYLAALDARRITSLTVDAGLRMTVVEPAPNPVLDLVAAEDPTARTIEVFRGMLQDRGVVLWTGNESDARAAVGAERTPIATVESPTVAEHVRFAFERSDNHTADTLFRLVGLGLGSDDWTSSGEAIGRLLADTGADTTGLRLVDGSGLSRDDRISSRTLADIDRVMRGGDHGVAWRDALAIAGEEGTLRRRFRGTVADGRFLGKSGTLDDVTALAGTVEGPDGRAAFHVAAMANVAPGVGRFASIVVIDDLIALLAEDAAGCSRTSPPEDVLDDEFVVGGLYVDCP